MAYLLRAMRNLQGLTVGWSFRFRANGGRVMSEDQKLSEHFTLKELTQTSHQEFQDENRRLSDNQIVKLKMVAYLLEEVRGLVLAPIIVHSGYRCLPLNRAIGSGDTSQHTKCEAVDFSVKGVELTQVFKQIRQAAHNGKIKFGQLIYEKASRSYGAAEWIHISTGAPYRDEARCGEVLTMNESVYEILERIA